MAFIFIHSFQIPADNGADSYVLEYDPETREKRVSFQSAGGEQQRVVDESDLGGEDGEAVWEMCVGGNRHVARLITVHPFFVAQVEENSPLCGVIPPPSCDLAILDIITEEESGAGTFDGTITITAMSSATANFGVKQYSLDGASWQLSNTFEGLNSGAYTVFVKDSNGCIVSQAVSVGRVAQAPPVTSLSFPWQERICYFFRLVRGGVATTTREPIKWDSVGMVGERDRDYHGWNYQYSDGEVQLEFDCPAGKEILEAAYEADGNDAEVDFLYGFTYEATEYTLFEGKIDFNLYKKRPGIVAVSVRRKDPTETLKSRLDTKVSMSDDKDKEGGDMNPAKPLYIELHSKEITRSFLLEDNTEYQWYPDGFAMTGREFYLQPDTTGSPSLQEIGGFNAYGLGLSTDSPLIDKRNFEVRFGGQFTFKVAYKIKLKYSANAFSGVLPYTIKHFIQIGATTPQQMGASITHNNNLLPGVHDLDVSYEASGALPAGGKVYIYSLWQWNAQLRVYPELTQTYAKLEVSALEAAPSSNTKGWMLFDAVNQVIKSITAGRSRLKSTLLQYQTATQTKDGGFALFVLNNGYCVRNFNPEQRPLHLSFKTALQSLKAHAAVGFGIEKEGSRDVVRLEPVEYFYRDRQILVIEETSEYEEEVARELIYNEVETGYNKYKTDGYNVLDEFNTRHEYLTPIRSHKAKLVAKSDFIASGYSIEDVRRQQYNDTPQDSYENDEDPFIISVRRVEGGSALITERNEAFLRVEGVLSPDTAYNLRLSPKRMLLPHGAWIGGALAFKGGTELIRNTFVDKNGELLTQFVEGEERVNGDMERRDWKEKDHVALEHLLSGREPIYRPEWVRVKCRLRPDQVLQINEAMRGALDEARNYGYLLIKSPEGVYNAVWPWKLTYNFATEKCEITALKRYRNPTPPAGDCCPWLVVNGCSLIVNGQKMTL